VYALIESGGRQYRAQVGATLRVERLPQAVGEQIAIERVLLVADGSHVTVGTPTVPGARVLATVVAQARGPKIRIFKYKPKKRYRRRGGHRQWYTTLRVDEIIPGDMEG
jgi:large subunit ribosomal protein L21